jgi:hypothetical protein
VKILDERLIELLPSRNVVCIHFYLAAKISTWATSLCFQLSYHSARVLYDTPAKREHQAHFPNSAINAAPRKTQKIINVSRLLSLVRSGLNKKSLANSSTSPV